MRKLARAMLAFVLRHRGALLAAWLLTAALGALPWLAVPGLAALAAAMPARPDGWATADAGWLLEVFAGPHAPLSGPPAPTPASFPTGATPGAGMPSPEATLTGSALVLLLVPLLAWLLGPLLASLTLGRALLAEARGGDRARGELWADLRLVVGPFYRLWAAGIPWTLAVAALFGAAGAILGRIASPRGAAAAALVAAALGAGLARLAVDAGRPAMLRAAGAGLRPAAWPLFRALLRPSAWPLWATLVALAAGIGVAGRFLAALQGWVVWSWLPAPAPGTLLLLLLQQLAVLLQTALHFAGAGAGAAFDGWPEGAAVPAPAAPPTLRETAAVGAEPER
ncbi:MAG: hypothetical protein QJR14_03260 [Bacillota bacterium]|nr:hypothetical protein [Bacillota bacterium]